MSSGLFFLLFGHFDLSPSSIETVTRRRLRIVGFCRFTGRGLIFDSGFYQAEGKADFLVLLPVGEAGAEGVAGERGGFDAGAFLEVLEGCGVFFIQAEPEVTAFCCAHNANILRIFIQCQHKCVAFCVGNANIANMSREQPTKKKRISFEIDEQMQKELETATQGTGLGTPEIVRVGLTKVIREWRQTGAVVVESLKMPSHPQAA